MSRLFVVILKCFKLLDMSYLPMQEVVIFTVFIGLAVPQMGASACCCSTILSENIGGSTTLADIAPDSISKAAISIHLFFISHGYYWLMII